MGYKDHKSFFCVSLNLNGVLGKNSYPISLSFNLSGFGKLSILSLCITAWIRKEFLLTQICWPKFKQTFKSTFNCLYVVISVWSWNFKDSGSLNAKFLVKNQHTQRNPLMNYGWSKSAKIVLSNSIFYVKNQPNFFKKKFI